VEQKLLGGSAGSEHALDTLRRAIQSGDMVPGQRLVEAELAETLNVTRASVRAALVHLSGEGLVERVPNRGARVRSIPLSEAVQITECRMVLEGLCAAKAASHATPAQIAELVDIGERMRGCVEAGEPLKYSGLNAELHAAIRAISRQPVASDLLERLNAQLVRHQFRLSLQPGRTRVSLAGHLELIEAIRDRDPARAEAAARRHLASVIEALSAANGS